MIFFSLLLFVAKSIGYHEQGPPSIDSGFFNKYTYYYDIYINETTRALPQLTTIMDNVDGALYISGNVRISQRELKKFFEKLTYFVINNTNFQDLSFLKLQHVGYIDESKFSIQIENNENLTSLGLRIEDCFLCYGFLSISNNPKLNLTENCYGIIETYSLNRLIKGNLADCGCTIEEPFNEYVKTMPSTCEWMVGNISLDHNSDYDLLMEKMINVKKLSGGISAINTSFPDLAFLSSLEKVDIDKYIDAPFRTIDTPSFNIFGNQNLTSLKMKPLMNGLYLTIQDNPSLCILAQELELLLQGDFRSSLLDIDICFDENTPDYWCKVPESGNFKEYPDNCVFLVGDVIFGANYDIWNSYKLGSVKKIYGSLNISNSLLRNANMLGALVEIISVKENIHPMILSNNSKMTRLVGENRMNILESNMEVIIENNTNLKVYNRYCGAVQSRKPPIVRNNLANCDGSDDSEKSPEYDKNTLNVDAFYEIPKYVNILFPDPNNDDDQHQNPPGNGTDYYEDEDENGTTEPTEKFVFDPKYYLTLIFSIFCFSIFE